MMDKQGLPLVFVVVLVVLGCAAGAAVGLLGARFVLPTPEPAVISEADVTYTSYPTYTPYPQPTLYPTYTPLPTYTPYPSPLPEPTLIPTAQPGGLGLIGTIVVNSWRYEITDVRVDPGLDPSRKVISLLGTLTNEGMKTDTFTAFGKLILRDSQGREYEDDHAATSMAEDKYDTEISANIDPGATKYVAIGYSVVADETQFTIIPGSLVASWSGDIVFTLP